MINIIFQIEVIAFYQKEFNYNSYLYFRRRTAEKAPWLTERIGKYTF